MKTWDNLRQFIAKAVAPKGGKVHHPRFDDLDPVWVKDISPEKIITHVKNAVENGDPSDLIDTFDRLQRTDLVLRGILKTRLRAYTACEWNIVSAADMPGEDTPDEGAAQKAQEYCIERLNAATGFDDAIDNIADGILYGVTASECVWEKFETGHTIKQFVPLPHKSLFGDPMEPWRVRFPVSLHDYTGVSIENYPDKFVLHCPERIGTSPWGGGVMIAATLLAGLKHLGLRCLALYAEGFGTPIVNAFYQMNSSASDITAMMNLVKASRTNRWGVFPAGTEIEILESMKSGSELPQSVLMDRIDKYFAISILGQELTTQTSAGGGGAYALGQVHERVRQDIRDADIAAEAKTVREQILRPMLKNSALAGAPVPYFVRKTPEAKDRIQEVEVLDGAVNRLGLKITNAQAYDALELPIPDGVDPAEFVEGSPTPMGGFGFGDEFAAKKKRYAANAIESLRPERRTSPHAALADWVNRGVDAGRKQVVEVVKVLDRRLKLGRANSDINITTATKQILDSLPHLPITALSGVLEKYLLACQLAGVLHLQTRQRIDAKRFVATEPKLKPTKQPFEAAVESLRQRVFLTPEAFLALETAARSRAGRIAGMQNVRLVEAIYKVLGNVIEAGGTVRDFRQALKEVPELESWGGQGANHVALVFRQNATMAFQAGHYVAMRQSGLGAYRWRGYPTSADTDSCPICIPYIDKVFSISDTSIYPGGAHFGCDCWAESLFDDETGPNISTVSNPEWLKSQQSPSALKYDPAHFANVAPFDLSGVAPELRRGFEDYLEKTSA